MIRHLDQVQNEEMIQKISLIVENATNDSLTVLVFFYAYATSLSSKCVYKRQSTRKSLDECPNAHVLADRELIAMITTSINFCKCRKENASANRFWLSTSIPLIICADRNAYDDCVPKQKEGMNSIIHRVRTVYSTGVNDVPLLFHPTRKQTHDSNVKSFSADNLRFLVKACLEMQGLRAVMTPLMLSANQQGCFLSDIVTYTPKVKTIQKQQSPSNDVKSQAPCDIKSIDTDKNKAKKSGDTTEKSPSEDNVQTFVWTNPIANSVRQSVGRMCPILDPQTKQIPPSCNSKIEHLKNSFQLNATSEIISCSITPSSNSSSSSSSLSTTTTTAKDSSPYLPSDSSSYHPSSHLQYPDISRVDQNKIVSFSLGLKGSRDVGDWGMVDLIKLFSHPGLFISDPGVKTNEFEFYRRFDLVNCCVKANWCEESSNERQICMNATKVYQRVNNFLDMIQHYNLIQCFFTEWDDKVKESFLIGMCKQLNIHSTILSESEKINKTKTITKSSTPETTSSSSSSIINSPSYPIANASEFINVSNNSNKQLKTGCDDDKMEKQPHYLVKDDDILDDIIAIQPNTSTNVVIDVDALTDDDDTVQTPKAKRRRTVHKSADKSANSKQKKTPSHPSDAKKDTPALHSSKSKKVITPTTSSTLKKDASMNSTTSISNTLESSFITKSVTSNSPSTTQKDLTTSSLSTPNADIPTHSTLKSSHRKRKSTCDIISEAVSKPTSPISDVVSETTTEPVPKIFSLGLSPISKTQEEYNNMDLDSESNISNLTQETTEVTISQSTNNENIHSDVVASQPQLDPKLLTVEELSQLLNF